MATPLFANLSSLIGLTRKHGIDVNPTLLRVVTDLYIQAPAHPADDERQYADMILSLIGKVDSETVAIVVNKLRAYPGLAPVIADGLTAYAADVPAAPAALPAHTDLGERFLNATAEERRRLLAELEGLDIAGIDPPRDAPTAVRTLENLALSGRPGDFIREIERSLTLSRAVAQRIVNDAGGEPTLVIAKALGMPIEVLQRVLLLANPSVGQSVKRIFALTALYEEFSRTAALRLVALWRSDVQPVRATATSARSPRATPAPASQPSPAAQQAGLKPGRQRTT